MSCPNRTPRNAKIIGGCEDEQGASAGGTQLVYSPTKPSSGSVFSDFQELYERFQEVPGMIQIFLDREGALPAPSGAPAGVRSFPVPAGVYDFESRTQFSAPKEAQTLNYLIPEEGVRFHRVMGLIGGVGMINTTSAPVIYVSTRDSVGEVFLLQNGGTVVALPGAAPCIQVSASGAVLALDNGNIVDMIGAGNGVVEVAPGVQAVVAIIGALGVLDASTIVGDVTSALVGVLGLPSADVDILTQPGFAGTVIEVLFAESHKVLYVPDDVANWSGVDPSNVGAALDRIAAAVGPIP